VNLWCATVPGLATMHASLGVSADDPLEVELGQAMCSLAAAKWAPGSLEQYAGAFRRFESWCAERTPPRRALPADAETVALYMMFLTRHANTFSVVKTASAAIAAVHRLNLSPTAPTSHPLVCLVRDGAQAVLGGRLVNQKDALDFEVLRKAALKASGSDDFMLRYSVTAALVAFCCFLRYSDLAILTARDVKFLDGHMELFLEQRKNDQLREGSVVVVHEGCTGACPVWWMKWWYREMDLDPTSETPVFQRYNGRVTRFRADRCKETMGGQSAPYHQVRSMVLKLLAGELGMPLEVVEKRFGTQSLRSGGATLVAAEGVSDRMFQRHGGWRSAEVKDRYVKDTLQAKLAVTAMMHY